MSIIESIKNMFNPYPEDRERPLDFGEDGKVLFKDDIISDVLEELEKRRTERAPLEQMWKLNARFLAGDQYVDYNTHTGEIAQLPVVMPTVERDTYNQIAPLIETRTANLKKINYRMKVRPRTNELKDWQKAEVSTALLQYKQSESDFDMKKNTAIAWNELCGNCFFLSWWNTGKGDVCAIEKRIEIGENGIENIREQAYFQGDLDYGLITPYEIFPESIFKQGIDNQRSIIIEQVMSIDDIYDLYGLEVEGSSVNTFQLTPIVSGGGLGRENTVLTLGTRTVDDAERVITYFERPSRRRPNGRLIIIVGEEHIVYYGNLPYTRIPITQMICREVAGQFFGKSAIEDLIPRQKRYNSCLNMIHEYIKRVAIGSYVVEEGALIDIVDFEENGAAPGSIILKYPGASDPVPIKIGQLPAELMQERLNLKADMEYVAGTSQLMVNGVMPSGVTSGQAIQNLVEIDNTRLSLTGDHLRNAMKNLAVIWLEIEKLYVDTPRVVNCVGANGIGNAIVWSGEDINSYDVEYLTENELILSEDMQRENFMNAYNMGFFTDDDGRIPARVKNKALEAMKVGNYSELMSINTLHIQAAQRENSFFERGSLPEVSEFDDHQIHEEEHLRYILQMDFQILKMNKPEYAAALEDHLRRHRAIIKEEKQREAMQMMMAQGGNVT